MSSSWTCKSRKAVPQRRSSCKGLSAPGQRCVETSDDVTKDDCTPTPDSRIWDFSPIRLGAAKTARESVKSPDEFEAPGVEPVFPEKRQAITYAENRASFRSGEIRILDSSGNVSEGCGFESLQARG